MHTQCTALRYSSPLRGWHVLAGFIMSATLTACAGSATDTPAPAIATRDSAGVRIVEHAAATIAALPTWTIDTVPELQLRPPEEEGFTAIGDILTWPDGRVFVADRRLRDVREFAANGAFSRVVARSGAGPGEVTFVSRLQHLPGDTLAILDGNARLASLFDAAGRFVTRVQYPRLTNGSSLRMVARLHDGRWIANIRPPAVAPKKIDGAIRRDSLVVVRLAVGINAEVAGMDTIAHVPDQEVFDVITTQGGESYPDVESLRGGRAAYVASNGDRVVVGANERYELHEYGNARLTRLLRVEATAEPMPADAAQRVIAWSEQATANLPAEARAELAAMRKNWRFATTKPYHERLQFGDDGTLWASAPTLLPSDARRYLVFDSAGHALAHVALPVGVEPFRMTREHIVGTWIDENDVPHVMRWRLRAAP